MSVAEKIILNHPDHRDKTDALVNKIEFLNVKSVNEVVNYYLTATYIRTITRVVI